MSNGFFVTWGGPRATTTTRKETTMMSKTDPTKGRMLSTQDVAERLGVKPDTVSGYRHHGYMPPPDGKLGKTVWWWASTIDKWQAQRPGQSWKKGQTKGPTGGWSTAPTPEPEPEPAPKPAGWGWPGAAAKPHYFAEGSTTSLCGRWWYTGHTDPGSGPQKNDCGACTRRLAKLGGAS